MTSTLQFRRFVTVILLIAASTTLRAQTPFWDNTEGPYGVTLWAALVTTNGTYYGGSGDGKIYRKLPGQDRWDIVLNTTSTILAMAEFNNTVYASDDHGTLVASTDNGNSWESIAAGLPSDQIRSIALNDNGDMFVGTGEGIYKRVPGKGGVFMWEHKPFNTQYGMFTFAICNNKHGVMYAGSGRGIYRSDDQGETWTISAMDETANSIMSLATNAQGDVYAGTAEQGLFINYANDGEDNTWVSIGGDAMVGTQIRQISVIDGSKVFVSVTGNGTYYSETNTDWQEVLNEDSRAGTFYDQVTDQFVTATMNGLWVSPYGETFSYSQTGLPQDISFLTSLQSKVIAMGDGDTKIYESSDKGNSWTEVFGNSEGRVTCYAEKNNEDRFVGCVGGFNGSPWVSAYIYLDGIGRRDWFSLGFPQSVTKINTVYITSKDSIYVGTNAGIYYIDTRTYNVDELSSVGSGVNVLSLSENPAGYLYASTDNGLYISADHGLHWTIHKLEGATINGLALYGEHEAYAATSTGLYYLSGLEAEPVLAGGFKGGSFNDVARDDHGHLYAIGDGTVYYAADENSTWEPQMEGVENYGYAKLLRVDNNVYLSTDVGLYKHTYAQEATITLSGLGTFTYNGQQRAATATTVPAGLPVTILYNDQTGVPVDGGTYQVTAIINDPGYAGRAQGRILIEKIGAQITLSGLGNRSYNGSPISVTATTVPAGLPVVITYNSKPETPVDIGEYYVRAVINHPSYKGETTGDMVIQDPVMGVEDPWNHLLLVYPVPANGKLVIESKQDAIGSLVISDVMGRPVQQVHFDIPVRSYNLDVSHYPTGTLLLQLITNKKERIVRKIQVTH
jgi:hypothetical protein